MKSLLALAAAALFAASLPATAAPADWVGKELPALGVDFLGNAPEFKGKPMIVEFWATWCPPCRASIPHLNEVNKKFKEKGLVIIGVTDEDKGKVVEFQKTLPMDYNVAFDKGGKLGEKFGITGIPHAFIVGKDGKIVWEGHPMRLAEADIEKVLK
jgi:cytochrome c biogenesis protein CcmG/thiol:disulfide interchange protein DsbE